MKGPNFFDRRRKQEQMAGQSAEIEKLKAEVEAARLQLEKGAEQGVSDREFLIEQMIKNGELLDAVRQALEHFASIPGLDQLNEEDRGRLEDLKKILSPLEEREIEIKGRIATISDRPEVMGKLKDTAQQEHTEIIRRELEESYAELGQKINIIAESILSLAKLKEIWFISESNTEIRDAWEAMLKVVRQEIRNLE